MDFWVGQFDGEIGLKFPAWKQLDGNYFMLLFEYFTFDVFWNSIYFEEKVIFFFMSSRRFIIGFVTFYSWAFSRFDVFRTSEICFKVDIFKCLSYQVEFINLWRWNAFIKIVSLFINSFFTHPDIRSNLLLYDVVLRRFFFRIRIGLLFRWLVLRCSFSNLNWNEITHIN